MELSLDDLLSGLQAAQQKTSTVRLSERNVIELVNKLKQHGLLGDELLHSSNGREYITRDRLRDEVSAALQQAGGRIPLVELPTIIGVDLAHCERAATEAAESAPKGSIFQTQGELFSSSYFDSLGAEIDEMLQDAGMVTIGDLARRYSLGVELLSNAISARMGKIINGRLEGGVIYTDTYLARIKAQLRGALRGSLAPVTIASLRKDLGVEGVSAVAGLVPSLIDELVKQGAVYGKLAPGGSSWIPAGYVKSQQEGVKGFYQQNGYITYDMASKQGVSNGKQFLQTAFPDGLALSSVFLSPAMLQQVDAAVEEAVHSDSWCDAQLSMPGMLSTNDAIELVEKCLAASAANTKILAGTCVLSASFIDSIRKVLLSEAAAIAQEAHTKRKKGNSTASQSGNTMSASSSGKNNSQSDLSSTKAAGGKKKGATSQFELSDDDGDDWDTGKGGKGGGKKGGKAGKKSSGGGGNTGKAAVSKNQATSSQQQKSKKPTTQSTESPAESAATLLSIDKLKSRIIQLYPDIEGCGVDGGLDTALAEELRPEVVLEFERSLAAIFTAGAERRKKLREAASAELDQSWLKLQLYGSGVNLFENDEVTAVTLTKHVLKTYGTECLDSLLHYVAADSAAEDTDEKDSGNAATTNKDGVLGALSSSQRAVIINESPADIQAALTNLLSALNSATTTVEEFINVLQLAAESVGLRLKRMDKKTETRMVAEEAKVLKQRASEAVDSAALVLIAVPYLLAVKCGRCVVLPGKALSAGVDRLKEALTEEEHETVAGFHAGVVEKLKSGGGEGGDEKLEVLTGKVHSLIESC